jgi:hypothetical protein
MPSVYQVLINQNITQSWGGGYLNLADYTEVALLARFDGDLNAVVSLEIYNDNHSIAQEKITVTNYWLPGQGWVHFTKVYRLYAPTFSIALYNPTSPMTARISVYAACCA